MSYGTTSYGTGATYGTGYATGPVGYGTTTTYGTTSVAPAVSYGSVSYGAPAVGVGYGSAVGGVVSTTTATTVGTTTVAPTIYEKAVVQEIPSKTSLISGESRVEYIPIERRHTEYDQIERVEQVPVQRVVTEYQEVRRQQTVPVERVVQDYYAVEYQTEYVPRVVEEKVIDYVQQEKVFERVEYVPYER